MMYRIGQKMNWPITPIKAVDISKAATKYAKKRYGEYETFFPNSVDAEEYNACENSFKAGALWYEAALRQKGVK